MTPSLALTPHPHPSNEREEERVGWIMKKKREMIMEGKKRTDYENGRWSEGQERKNVQD